MELLRRIWIIGVLTIVTGSRNQPGTVVHISHDGLMHQEGRESLHDLDDISN